MDPNLLPSEFRSKEDREQARLKKQPVGFGVELNMPAKERKKSDFRSAPQAPGLWSMLFGTKARPAAPEKLTVPAAGFSAGRSVDLLSNSRNIKRPYVPMKPAAGQTGPGWLGNLFGRPMSPIADSGTEEKTPVAMMPNAKWSQPRAKRAVRELARQPAGDSWSAIINNLFGFGRKKRIDFRLASFGSGEPKAPPVGAPLPAISQPPLPRTDFTPYHAIAPKHAAKAEAPGTKSAYHAAPKREKSSEFNVNLMPQELLARLSSGGAGDIKSIALAVIVPAAIITIGYGVLVLLQNDLKSRMAVKQSEFDGLQKQIGDFIIREKQNNQVADRVAAIKKLLAEKIIWNNFFTQLEKYTLDGVYFTDLTADTSGVLTLPGVAADYDVLARQLAVLRDADDFIKDAKLTNAQLISEGKAGVVGVGFQLRLTLQDSVFKKAKILK